MLISAVLLLLPALALSATELLLEPSGGKAILVDTALLDKRDVTAQQTEMDRQDSQDTVQVTRHKAVLSFTLAAYLYVQALTVYKLVAFLDAVVPLVLTHVRI